VTQRVPPNAYSSHPATAAAPAAATLSTWRSTVTAGLGVGPIFGAYAESVGRAFLNRELYLPKEWAADDAWRRETGVPTDANFATMPYGPPLVMPY
jgi:hypothetical protein